MCCGIGAAPAADAGGPLEPFGDCGCSIGLCCARTQSAIGHDPKHGGSRDTVFEKLATEYDADRALGNIIRDDNRAAKIVANLRGLLKKQNSAELQEFDLGEVIRDALEIVAPDAARRGIEVAGCTAHAALLVRGDRIQLQQVILNLAMNAINALSSCDSTRKKMSINAAAVPGFAVAVSVADNGVGIPPETGPVVAQSFASSCRSHRWPRAPTMRLRLSGLATALV